MPLYEWKKEKVKLDERRGVTSVFLEDLVQPGTGVPAGSETEHVEPAGPGDTPRAHLKLNSYVTTFVQALPKPFHHWF